MTLSRAELRCIAATRRLIAQVSGRRWQLAPGPRPDDLDQNRPTPEAILQDGAGSQIAIEVKGLTGDESINNYRSAWLSLERSLAPSYGGSYTLIPAGRFRLPAPKAAISKLKRLIEATAIGMRDRETRTFIFEEREAQMIIRDDGPRYIHCSHHNAPRIWAEVSQLVPGHVLVIDPLFSDHELLVGAEREQFIATMVAAIRAARDGAPPVAKWGEPWRLYCHTTEGRSVGLVAGQEFRPRQMAAAAVEAMIRKAQPKFAYRRWAPLHVLALDSQEGALNPELVRDGIVALEEADREHIDLFVFVERRHAQLVWPDDWPAELVAGRFGELATDSHTPGPRYNRAV